MKKILLFLILIPSAVFAETDNVVNSLGYTGDSIYKYTPIIKSLCYTIAGIIGIVGAFSIYYGIQNNEQNIKKRIITFGGSCIMFISMAIALPKFFNYKETGMTLPPSGSISQNTNGNFTGGDKYDDIITNIPPLNHDVWQPDPQYSPSPEGQLVRPPMFEDIWQ